MELNGKSLDIDKLVSDLNIKDNFIHDVGNGIYLSNNQIEILKRNKIDYKKYSNLSSLIFDIENQINDDYEVDAELDNLLSSLSEINYYKNTKK